MFEAMMKSIDFSKMDRSMYLLINGSIFSSEVAVSGVSQGSLLGLNLFLVNVEGLPVVLH